MTMIALGGIIGAGLFVGSSAVIGTVGPSLISLAIVVAAAFLRERLPQRQPRAAAGQRRGPAATA